MKHYSTILIEDSLKYRIANILGFCLFSALFILLLPITLPMAIYQMYQLKTMDITK